MSSHTPLGQSVGDELPNNEPRASDQELFSASIDSLGRVLETSQHSHPRHSDPLMNAAVLVGMDDGISMQYPGISERTREDQDPIESIARASRVRFRWVVLADDWWKSDCGAMVGYLEDDDEPVALIPSGSGSYDIVDPRTGARTPVDYKTAEDLDLRAIRFYRRLPDKVSNAWSIARWSLRGKTRDIVFVILLSVAITLLGMLIPQATVVLMDNAIPDANQRLVIELGLAMLLAVIGTTLFGFSQAILTIRIGITSDAVSQASVWDRLLNLRLSIFKEYGSGDILDRAMGVSAVSRDLNGQAMRSILTSMTASLNLGLLYWYNASLATMVLVVGVVIVLVTVIASSTLKKYYKSLLSLQGEFFGFVVELVSATNKIRVAGAQRRAFVQWSNRYSEQLHLSLKANIIEDRAAVFTYSVPLLTTLLLYWFAAELLASSDSTNALTIGEFLAFNVAMGTFIAGITSLSDTAMELMDTFATAERAQPLLAAEMETNQEKRDPGLLRGSVELSDVYFKYSSGGPNILKGVNIKVEPGQFVAFAGTSGSGKSTIFRLLLGFEQPVSGRVLYDKQSLDSIDVTAVRRQLGVVLQHSRINTDSIFENIGAGSPVSLEQAWEAAKDAGLAADIDAMPMGMQTVISEGGGNLSGGQRQRLMIARALVRNPSILLFDEATSALDNRTQAIVSRSLNRRNVSRLVIAHRLSTIQEADKIYVLDDGLVVEEGNFEELSNSDGLFASMMNRQSTD